MSSDMSGNKAGAMILSGDASMGFVAIALIACAQAGNDKPTAEGRPEDIAAYQVAAPKAGKAPEAHFKLALWCEGRGMVAARNFELNEALRLAPDQLDARALAGFVKEEGHWQRPEEVLAKVQADPVKSAKFAAYEARRALAGESAEDQVKLADWCQTHGLTHESHAHLFAAILRDPSRPEPAKKLGLRSVDGHWVVPSQEAQAKREHAEAETAHHKWVTALSKLARSYASPHHQAEALHELGKVHDPLAAAAVWAVFAAGEGGKNDLTVKLLSQIEGIGASSRLALLALFDNDPQVRAQAIGALGARDPREYISPVIGYLRKPFNIETWPVGDPEIPGKLIVDGFEVRTYPVPTRDQFREGVYGMPGPPIDPVIFALYPHWSFGPGYSYKVAYQQPDPAVTQAFQEAAANPGDVSQIVRGLSGSHHSAPPPAIVNVNVRSGYHITYRAVPLNRPTATQVRQAQKEFEAAYSAFVKTIQDQLKADTVVLEEYNRRLREIDDQAAKILETRTGQLLGTEQEPWAQWWSAWTSHEGTGPVVAGGPAPGGLAQVLVEPLPRSRIASGTPVWTYRGLKPVESLKIGDRVLSQDTRTGALTFDAVVGVAAQLRSKSFRVGLEGGETLKLTTLERVWVAARGWVAARDLKPGDELRGINGRVRILTVEPGEEVDAANVILAEHSNLFTGNRAILAHDNSLVHPSTKPFDAPSEPLP
jgi:hypothetical protein